MSSDVLTNDGFIRCVVGIAEFQASAHPDDLIITYALGSCIGIAIHDPVAGVGGLVHSMLPSSELDTGRAANAPATFVDTGFDALIDACRQLGAHPSRMIIKAAGGADRLGGDVPDSFQIGRRNVLALRQLLWKRGMLLSRHDVGGSHPRTMSLAVGSGTVRIQVHGHSTITL